MRVDSAGGAQIGVTDLITPSSDSAMRPAQLRVALKPTAGVHDVYFVFRSPEGKGDGFLFGLLTATFETDTPKKAAMR